MTSHGDHTRRGAQSVAGVGNRRHGATGRLLGKWCAATVDYVLGFPLGVVILIYHCVGRRTEIEVDLPTALFEQQIEALAESSRVVSLDSSLVLLKAPSTSPDPRLNPIVVTFDDGTEDFAEVALPILQRHGIPVTLYIATDFVESGRPFPYGGRAMSWATIRDIVSTDLVTIGSHTHTHTRLDDLPADMAHDELDRSIGLIEDRTGVHPKHFCYPYSIVGSPLTESAVRARFQSAAVRGTRPNAYMRTDPYRLQRSPVQVTDGMKYFCIKALGGMRLEEFVRQVAVRLHYCSDAKPEAPG